MNETRSKSVILRCCVLGSLFPEGYFGSTPEMKTAVALLILTPNVGTTNPTQCRSPVPHSEQSTEGQGKNPSEIS